MVQVEEIEHIASTSTLRYMEETSRSIDATWKQLILDPHTKLAAYISCLFKIYTDTDNKSVSNMIAFCWNQRR